MYRTNEQVRRAKREAVPGNGRSAKRAILPTGKRSPGEPALSIRPDCQEELRARLKPAEEPLAAIKSGEVDALMVLGRRGAHVATLHKLRNGFCWSARFRSEERRVGKECRSRWS